MSMQAQRLVKLRLGCVKNRAIHKDPLECQAELHWQSIGLQLHRDCILPDRLDQDELSWRGKLAPAYRLY